VENIIDIEVVEVAQPTDPQFDTVLEEVENIAETLSEPISSLPMQDEGSEYTLILEDNISNRLNSTYTLLMFLLQTRQQSLIMSILLQKLIIW